MEPEDVSVGDHVLFTDERRRVRDALVVAVWPNMSGEDTPPGVNLVTVAADEDREDEYGRQTERPSSIVHEEAQSAPGNYWSLPE